MSLSVCNKAPHLLQIPHSPTANEIPGCISRGILEYSISLRVTAAWFQSSSGGERWQDMVAGQWGDYLSLDNAAKYQQSHVDWAAIKCQDLWLWGTGLLIETSIPPKPSLHLHINLALGQKCHGLFYIHYCVRLVLSIYFPSVFLFLSLSPVFPPVLRFTHWLCKFLLAPCFSFSYFSFILMVCLIFCGFFYWCFIFYSRPSLLPYLSFSFPFFDVHI